jgi:hypothetical protein
MMAGGQRFRNAGIDVRRGLGILCWIVLGLVLFPACKKSGGGKGPMPIYVTPFYDSQGLQVEVGAFGKELAAAADAATIQGVIGQMRDEWSGLSPEVMYVAAIRLYDLGQKDDAAYWFYSAQYRAMLFRRLVAGDLGTIGSKPFELVQAYGAFQQLAGEYINGYAFGNPARLAEVMTQVQEEGNTLPDMKRIFPDVALIDETLWPEANEGVNNGLASMIRNLRTGANDILAQRKAAGIEGKY